MLFPDGVLNNSENMNCGTLYPGVYHLAIEAEKKVVPIVSYYNYENQVVYIAADNPIDFNNMEKEEANTMLRDKIATIGFNLARISYEQAKKINRILTPEEFVKLNPEPDIELYRKDLTGDIHLAYMQKRKRIYNEVKWITPNWDEEIMHYKEHGIILPEDAISYIDNIDFSQKSPEIIEILSPVLKRRLEYRKYNFKDYMKKNWDK